MVLQVGTHPGQVMLHFNADTLQQSRRADARQLQNLRGPDAARTQYHLLPGLDLDHLLPCPDLCARAAFFAVGLGFDEQLADLGFVPQLKVGT